MVESGCEGVLPVVWDDQEAAAPSFPQVLCPIGLCHACKLPDPWLRWIVLQPLPRVLSCESPFLCPFLYGVGSL